MDGIFPPMQSSVVHRAEGFAAISPAPLILATGREPQNGQGNSDWAIASAESFEIIL